MNSARDDVVDKLMHLSFETRQLIENSENASEETKFYKSKCEILEEELRRVNCENEALRRENENLRDKLQNESPVGESWIPVVKNANLALNNIAPNVAKIVDKFRISENARIQLEREIVALKEENANLQVGIEEKNLFVSKQNADFLDLKKMVNDYQTEISRLDAELKDCHSRVLALNENLEIINAANLDLAEYTSFKSLSKKLGTKEDASQVVLKLQTLYEIEELLDKKLWPRIDSLMEDEAVRNSFTCDENSNVASKVKDYLEKTLHVIEKLNENNVRSSVEYENVIRTKDNEIMKLKELSYHLGLYNEILEKTLKQCRDNAKMDTFVEESTDRLMVANTALRDNFEQLRCVYSHSCRYNDQLFAKFSQLRSWLRILKIHVDKRPSEDARNFFILINELLGEVAEKKINFDRRIRDSNQVLKNCESSLALDDCLKNTVDKMTREVKRLTGQVEQQMNEKMREIESLKGEMDSVKIDNRQLANKVKNCNREIISLSTENYDLNEKLSIFSRMGDDCETLKNELQSAKNKLDQYEHLRYMVAKDVDKFAQLQRACTELKRENVRLKQEVSGLRSTFDDLLQRSIRLVISTNTRTVDLSDLQTKCAQFKVENQNLKVAVQNIREQIHEEISSLKSNLGDVLISPARVNLASSDIIDLMRRCRNLKQHHRSIKEIDFFSTLNDTIETARGTLSNKLQNVSRDLNRMQSDLNTTIDAKHQHMELVDASLKDILKITQSLKSSRESLSNLIETSSCEFARFSSAIRQNIQEALTRTFEHMKNSVALSNEEMIREMLEVNSELKNRSETIFVLNQRIEEFVKEKHNSSQLLAQQKKLGNDLIDQVSSQRETIAEKESIITTINDELQNYKLRLSGEIEKRNAELSSLTKLLEETRDNLRSKEDTISALECELSKAKDNQTGDGDVSSMGNISRTEEVSRLRDVEDSFEERYMKLRFIAVKMKKNIAELNQQLINEKSENKAIQSKLSVATEQAKRNQALQEECDRIADELELKTNEIKELKKIIVEEDKKNEKYESFTTQYHVLLAQKNDLEKEKNRLTSLVEQLKMEKFAEETLKKEVEKETQRLKQKVKEYDDSMKKIQIDLEQANFEARKRDTLTLEVRDYEKTISDLTEKLKTKTMAIDKLNDKLKICVESNETLVERIKELEEQISSFGASSKISDEQTLNLNKIISALQKDLEIKDALLKKFKQDVEAEKLQNEHLKLEFAETVTEVDSLRAHFKNTQESSNSRMKLTQSKLKTLEERLMKKISEFDKLKADFEAYKVRAHNVLQKHKNENNLKNNEEKLKIKIEDLSQTVKELRKRLDDALVDSNNRKTELKLLEASKEKLHTRMKEIQEACAEKTRELDNMSVEYKSYRLNNETLIKCYKDEIEDLRASCQKLDAQLREQTSSKEREITPEQKNDVVVRVERTEDASTGNSDNYSYSKYGVTLPISNEENSTRVKSQNRELVSLENLLNTDVIEEKQDDTAIAECRKQVEMLENQVAYLNGILNESEKNAARSEQHVAWLKDVNRRLQKTIDRAPHLQNGEYLKNVLFNFFTFPDGEEKCKLITILETLLQLTPEEKGILSAIAKGDRSEQKRSTGFASFFKLS